MESTPSQSKYFAMLSRVSRTCSKLARQNMPARASVSMNFSTLKASDMSDGEILEQVMNGKIAAHNLEAATDNAPRAAAIRRMHVESQLDSEKGQTIKGLPFEDFDSSGFYHDIMGKNCESVVGYVPLPVGVVGPLKVDDREVHVPMATTEGALVASTNRGARAVSLSGGATTVLLKDGMTRAPVVELPSLQEAAEVKRWLEEEENIEMMKECFRGTSRFGRLQEVKVTLSGRLLYLRFRCSTGDAMGMNMVSKGVDAAMAEMQARYPAVRLVSISGNMCIDKKPSALNWIEGRGKSCAAEAVIKGDVVRRVLKSDVQSMVRTNVAKNLIGSSMAGSIGGNNAHSANLVAAVYLATGQDPAQVVASSTCLTQLEAQPSIDAQGNADLDLRISVTMPSIEVGTVGGGTALPGQSACLNVLGLKGSSDVPGANAQQLARMVCATVLCGELSLMAALTSGHLVSAHMTLGRKEAKKDASGKEEEDLDESMSRRM